MTLEQLTAEVDALPQTAQMRVLEHLLDLMEPPGAELAEDEQSEIIRRRVEEVRSGFDCTVPGEDVLAEMRGLVGR